MQGWVVVSGFRFEGNDLGGGYDDSLVSRHVLIEKRRRWKPRGGDFVGSIYTYLNTPWRWLGLAVRI